MTTIKVVSSSLKKATDKFKIYEITDEQGLKYDSFDDLPAGEHKVEITPNSNPSYNSRIKVIKDKKGFGFTPRDTTFDKRRCALESAVRLAAAGQIKLEQLTPTRDKFFEYLNQ
jgi:hypothetical protein